MGILRVTTHHMLFPFSPSQQVLLVIQYGTNNDTVNNLWLGHSQGYNWWLTVNWKVATVPSTDWLTDPKHHSNTFNSRHEKLNYSNCGWSESNWLMHLWQVDFITKRQKRLRMNMMGWSGSVSVLFIWLFTGLKKRHALHEWCCTKRLLWTAEV